jgi:peptide/nickel transport system substrate-binding protein
MRIRLAALVLTATIAVAGCTGDKSSGDGGGTVIAGMGGADPTVLLPQMVFDETSDAVTDLLFEKLAAIGPRLSSVGDAGFTPRIAKSWDWSRDSLSITFHIDPAARFHDGTPVTASDLRYSYRITKDTMLGSPVTPLIANIDSVTVVDSLTATFWYHKRSPTQFFDAVYQLPPLPEHVYGKVPVADLKTSDVTKNPVGTGRFRFAKWERGVRLELIADTANFLGRPKLDRVIFMLAQAPTSAAAALLAGQLDFFIAFPIDQADRLDSSSVIRAVPYAQNGYGYLAMNTFDRKSNRPHPILSDIAVRRALSMSLDRQAMLTNVFKTSGKVAHGPFPTGATLSDTTLSPPAFDTTAAGAMLDAAGWRRGADGVRVKNGRPLAIEILVPASSLIRMRYAELIQAQLNRVGFRVELARAAQDFFPRWQARDFDMAINAVFTDPSVAGIQQYWSGAGIRAGSNTLRYRNPQVDALLDSASNALDPSVMNRQVSAAFKRIIDDAPAVWLYSAGTVAAAHRRIELAPLPLDGWWNSLTEWSIPADKRIDRDRVGLRPAATP